jgi:hypothetical protein
MTEHVSLPKGHIFTLEEEQARERWARRFITRLEGVGQGLGYGIFHGGSLIRDIDIVAVPWSSTATNAAVPDVLVTELIHRMNLQMGNYGDTLFGHRFVALWAEGHEDHQIDLKIIAGI